MKERIICRNCILQVYLNKNRTIVQDMYEIMQEFACVVSCRIRTTQFNYFATTVSLNKLLIIDGETTVSQSHSMLQTTNEMLW